jgi:hypothetical protein
MQSTTSGLLWKSDKTIVGKLQTTWHDRQEQAIAVLLFDYEDTAAISWDLRVKGTTDFEHDRSRFEKKLRICRYAHFSQHKRTGENPDHVESSQNLPECFGTSSKQQHSFRLVEFKNLGRVSLHYVSGRFLKVYHESQVHFLGSRSTTNDAWRLYLSQDMWRNH